MNVMEAIDRRISCRAFSDRPIEQDKLDALGESISRANEEADLELQLFGPRADGTALDLSGRMFANSPAHYLACVGPDTELARERVGYFVEGIVLEATMMGLGTCWVAGTFDRDTTRFEAREGSVLHSVIPIAYPAERMPLLQRTIRAGLRKRDKKPQRMYQGPGTLADEPQWVQDAIEAVAKGPSAVNEQPVVFVREAADAPLKATLPAIKTGEEWADMGIAKYHFEAAARSAGMEGRWEWGTGGAFVLADKG